MAEIFQLQAKDVLLRLNHYDVLNSVQNSNWDPVFNEEYLEELGNENYMAQTITPEVNGSFDVMAAGSTVAILKRMIMTFDAQGQFSGYMAGAAATANNTGTITELDLEDAVFDLIEAKKANERFTRSVLLPRMHVSTINWTADAAGNATETYNFEGDLAEVYRQPYQNVLSLAASKIDDDTVELIPTGIVLAEDDASAVDGEYVVLALFINEDRVDAVDLTVDAVAQEVSVNPGGPVVRDGARLHLVVYRKYTPGVSDPTWPVIIHPVAARFMKASDIDIWLVPKTGAGSVDIAALADGALNSTNFAEGNFFLRCQSADINVDLRREALRQIKKNNRNSAVYYRAATFPLTITSSLNAFETDLSDWARIQGKSDTDILNLADFENIEWQIVVRYYHGDDVLQTTALLDARVVGRGSTVAVGGRAEVSWDFTGSQIKIEGSTPTP